MFVYNTVSQIATVNGFYTAIRASQPSLFYHGFVSCLVTYSFHEQVQQFSV